MYVCIVYINGVKILLRPRKCTRPIANTPQHISQTLHLASIAFCIHNFVAISIFIFLQIFDEQFDINANVSSFNNAFNIFTLYHTYAHNICVYVSSTIVLSEIDLPK